MFHDTDVDDLNVVAIVVIEYCVSGQAVQLSRVPAPWWRPLLCGLAGPPPLSTEELAERAVLAGAVAGMQALCSRNRLMHWTLQPKWTTTALYIWACCEQSTFR
jgi:hypothetical protein